MSDQQPKWAKDMEERLTRRIEDQFHELKAALVHTSTRSKASWTAFTVSSVSSAGCGSWRSCA